jgi:lysozyme
MNIDNAVSIAVASLINSEGFISSPRWDVNGYAIGYGNHYWEDGSPVTQDDDPIDQARAQQLLTFYAYQNAQAIAGQLGVDLNDNQLAALISIRYNCGTITTTLLNLINSGADSTAIAAQIQKTCVTSAGQPNSDLVARRQNEANLFTAPVLVSIGLIAVVAIVAWLILVRRT